MAAKLRIKRARITHISLCPRGKNRLKASFHSLEEDEVALDFRALACMGDEGLLTACVYLPESAGLPDTMGRVFEGSGLVECAHNWLTECIEGRGGIDIRHDFKALPASAVQICESFIIQKGDPRFANLQCEGKPVDPTGGWGAVLKIHDPQLREKYRKGEWEAVSMAGLAEVETIEAEDNQPMDQETKTLLASLAEGLKALNTVVAALPKTPVKAEDSVPAPSPAKIPFEGDPTKIEDLEAHAEKLLMAECDLSTAEGLARWRKHLESKHKRPSPTPANPAVPSPGNRSFQFAAELDSDAKSLLASGLEVVKKLNSTR